jgi:hypothetical protein
LSAGLVSTLTRYLGISRRQSIGGRVGIGWRGSVEATVVMVQILCGLEERLQFNFPAADRHRIGHAYHRGFELILHLGGRAKRLPAIVQRPGDDGAVARRVKAAVKSRLRA